MFTEDDLLPLSALQHLLFCERQCALIHVERLWVENLYTAEGRVLHQRVDSGHKTSRGDVRMEFGVPLRSLRLGLVGKADVVEFHREEDAPNLDFITSSHWRPFPVEYKRGRPKKKAWDKVQLCAQAMCLEEMLNVVVPRGALFYGKTRRRADVDIDESLRRETEDVSGRLHLLVGRGRTPPPVVTKACESCSFVEMCLPRVIDARYSVRSYIDTLLGDS